MMHLYTVPGRMLPDYLRMRLQHNLVTTTYAASRWLPRAAWQAAHRYVRYRPGLLQVPVAFSRPRTHLTIKACHD